MHFDFMTNMDAKINTEEVTSFLKLPVYTRQGKYVGHVRNIFLDMDEKKVSSLLVTNTNPAIVEGTVDVAVPYRWVNSVGDIVILSFFPDKVASNKKKKEDKNKEEQETSEIDVFNKFFILFF
jgi:sporulation protein YlmC with PRC-barrel domain